MRAAGVEHTKLGSFLSAFWRGKLPCLQMTKRGFLQLRSARVCGSYCGGCSHSLIGVVSRGLASAAGNRMELRAS